MIPCSSAYVPYTIHHGFNRIPLLYDYIPSLITSEISISRDVYIQKDIIIDNGYGSYFGHGLGHGVGLEIHEEPFLSPKGDEILRSGMVLTDEPGIYLPGKVGVRIEDLLLVKEKGCEILSNSTKEFIEI